MHECYEKNLELSKRMHENITGTKQLEADVNNMPSDFDIENFNMAEYIESAEKFIARCTDLIERVKTYQRAMYSAKFTVEQLQVYLHELRTQIGDADLIALTDQLFQRTHLRHLQKQIETFQSDYKHIFNKIEQEMEQNAEDDYDSEEAEKRNGGRG